MPGGQNSSHIQQSETAWLDRESEKLTGHPTDQHQARERDVGTQQQPA
jgi:hypothetical protein